MAELNPLTSDCVACWRLDEAVGSSNATDATGNGHTGIRSGTLSTYPGVFGLSRRRAAGGGYFTVTNPSALKLQTFTVAGWFNMIGDPRDDGGNYYTIGWSSGGVSYCFKLGDLSAAADSVRFGAVICMDHGSAKYVSAYGPQNYYSELDTWQHIVTVWDGTYLWLYINGRPHQKIKNTTGVSTIPYDSANITILNMAYYQDSALCDLSVYDTAKNDEWVYYQYNSSNKPAEPSGIFPKTSNTLLLYRMDENRNGECARDVTEAQHCASLPGLPPRPSFPVDGYCYGARDLSTGGICFTLYDIPAFHVDTFTVIAVCYPILGNEAFVKVVSGGYSWNLKLFSSGGKIYPRFSVTLSGGTVTATSPTDVTFNAWHVLVGTFDGSNVKIYCDGLPLNTAPNTTGTTDVVYDTGIFGIGYASGEADGFRGVVDECVLMDVAVDDDWVSDYDAPYVRYDFTTADVAPSNVEVLEDEYDYVSFPLRFRDDCKVVTIPEMPYIDDILKLTLFLRKSGIPLTPLGVGMDEEVFEQLDGPHGSFLAAYIRDAVNFSVEAVRVGDNVVFVFDEESNRMRLVVPYKYLRTGKDKYLSMYFPKPKTD